MADDNLEPQTPDPATEDQTLELELEGEVPPPAQIEPPQPTVEELRAELQREKTLREDAERRATEVQRYQAPPIVTSDPDYDKEEKQLADYRASGATAEQLSWLEWKIGNDRKLRSIERNTRQATQSAADIADKSAFDRLETTEPKRYRFFAPKVEAAVAEARRLGQNPPPRTMIYSYLVGEAVRNGTLKATPKPAAAAPTSPASTPTVARGRLPGVRSDTNPKDKSGMTEHEKRRARMKAEHDQGHYL